MSRSTKSASRSHSRSRSRSRSRSTSRSRSCSRSRSRKRRYSSRSRSRSRSHSPSYNREKKYQRGYQNNREFRGYHRGFRRPYNFRGRGRGFFPRGRYQRGGGGGGYNNNFRPNWKNYKQHPQKQHQQQQQQHHQQQQNNLRRQSHNLQKRSGSPPGGPSHHSDRSSSPLSRQSRHSSSSSHSSSPKCRPVVFLANQKSKDLREESSAIKDVQKEGGGDGEQVDLDANGDAKDSTASGKSERNWQGLENCSSSPKRLNSALIVGQSSQSTNQSGPSPKHTNDTNNGAPSWKAICCSPSPKKVSHETLNPMLSSYDFFSSEEYLEGDKTAISIAFRKFLEEQNKKATPVWEKCTNSEANDVDMEQRKVNGKASAVHTESMSRKYKGGIESEMSLKSFLKASPFLPAESGEEEELVIMPHSKSLHKDWHNGGESSKLNSKARHSANELFEDCFGKWKKVTCSQVANSDLDGMTEEIYHSRKKDESAALAAALAKRELVGKFEEMAPDMSCKARKVAKSSPAPTRNSDREMFMVRGEDSSITSSRKKEPKVNVRMDFLGDGLISSSDILAEERQLSQDLVQSSKKDQEFRSIFQHVQAAQFHRSPSELFAHHIVTILHHIKAQHFPSSGMTLNQRFTMYQRRAAEKEMMKPRKSPEIHRIIDVSTSAFKKHSQLFEAVKCSEDGTYKDGGEKIKGDTMDLRLDIERRKKYSTHERDPKQDQGRDSPNSSREQSVEKFSKCHKRSDNRKRSRSSSSSSSSSKTSQQGGELPANKSDPKDEGFNKTRLGQGGSPGPERGRPLGGFQVRIRGRGWNRGTCQGNSSHSNPTKMAEHQKSDGWEPEYTPKSKQYYLHDDRDGEADYNRGRGRGSFSRGRARFIIRKAVAGCTTNGPRWANDKFQANGEQGGSQEAERGQDHNEGKTDGDDH